MFLYTASRIFSFTWVMVSQLSTLTGISGLFSLSGFTQLSVWRFGIERKGGGGQRKRQRERCYLIGKSFHYLLFTKLS